MVAAAKEAKSAKTLVASQFDCRGKLNALIAASIAAKHNFNDTSGIVAAALASDRVLFAVWDWPFTSVAVASDELAELRAFAKADYALTETFLAAYNVKVALNKVAFADTEVAEVLITVDFRATNYA